MLMTLWKYRKAIAIGLAISAAAWIVLIVNGWRNDSAELNDLQAQVKAHNEQQEKADAAGEKLEKSRIIYRQAAGNLDGSLPADDYSVNDAIRLWLEAGIEAGEAAFQRHDSMPTAR